MLEGEGQHWDVISGNADEVMDLKLLRKRMEGLLNWTSRMKERAASKSTLQSRVMLIGRTLSRYHRGRRELEGKQKVMRIGVGYAQGAVVATYSGGNFQ